MSGDLSPADWRAELDDRLESALDAAEGGELSLARSSVLECPDRWYGQLVALSYAAANDATTESAAAPRDDATTEGAAAPAEEAVPETVLAASTAVELLRGYCRLRSELLVQLEDGTPHAPVRDPTAALLAGDYLNSTAYAAVGAVDHPRSRDAFEALVTATETVLGAFESRYVESAGDHCSFLDETAGSLGESAAVVGATLAGVDGPRRERFAALGRGAGTTRQVGRILSPGETPAIAPREPDERRLREHATRRLAEAERALDDLATSADVEPLRAFVAESLPGTGHS